MSNIEDDVKAAVEEFGECAFERFDVETAPKFWISSTNNSQLITAFARLKPLPELFAHDVKVYGDNAYLMWYWILHENDGISMDFSDNEEVKNAWTTVKRKTSIALPFDLELTKAGDVVEALTGDWEWKTVSFMGCTNEKIFVKWLDNTGSFFRFNELDRLRMKYQKRRNYE